ncbi:Serine/threonine-protein kinase [Diplonema papillatum]|nr:Serine/threonine-protein kinase [Diplonema papillatum]
MLEHAAATVCGLLALFAGRGAAQPLPTGGGPLLWNTSIAWSEKPVISMLAAVQEDHEYNVVWVLASDDLSQTTLFMLQLENGQAEHGIVGGQNMQAPVVSHGQLFMVQGWVPMMLNSYSAMNGRWPAEEWSWNDPMDAQLSSVAPADDLGLVFVAANAADNQTVFALREYPLNGQPDVSWSNSILYPRKRVDLHPRPRVDPGFASTAARLGPKANGTTVPKANGTTGPKANGTTVPKANGTTVPKANGTTGPVVEPLFPAITPAYCPVAGIVVAGGGGFLAGFNATTGDLIWRVPGFNITGTPAVAPGGIVVVSSTQNVFGAALNGVAALNITTGAPLWTVPVSPFETPAPVVLMSGGRLALAAPMTGVNAKAAAAGRSAAPAAGAAQAPLLGGIYVFSSANVTLRRVVSQTDVFGADRPARPGRSSAAVTYAGSCANFDACDAACRGAVSNVTALVFFPWGGAATAWQGGCYCRSDGLWQPASDATAESAQFGPPEIEWAFPTNQTQWSTAAAANNTVFVNGVNGSHHLFLALFEGDVLWLDAVPLLDARTVPEPPVPVVSSREVIFIAARSVYAFQLPNATAIIPPPAGSAWYSQVGYLCTVCGGLVLFILIAAFIRYRRPRKVPDWEQASPARKYEVVSKLGTGSYGVVYLVRRKHDKALVALKYLSCDSDEAQERALLEFRTMRTYQGHPNMIRVLETFMNWNDCDLSSNATPKAADGRLRNNSRGSDRPLLDDMQKLANPKYVCLVMPFYREGDLKHFALNYPGPVPEELLLDFAAQCCSLLHFLHDREHPLVHRDLKPENILMSDDCKSCVITDFGLAKSLHNQYCATRAGTLCYMAPECWAHHYGKEADMWAIGCILYSVATKRMEEHNIRVMFSEALQTDLFQEQIVSELNNIDYPVLSSLVAQLLEPDYHARPTAADVLAWLGVAQFDLAEPQPPNRGATADIQIPPVSNAQRKPLRCFYRGVNQTPTASMHSSHPSDSGRAPADAVARPFPPGIQGVEYEPMEKAAPRDSSGGLSR